MIWVHILFTYFVGHVLSSSGSFWLWVSSVGIQLLTLHRLLCCSFQLVKQKHTVLLWIKPALPFVIFLCIFNLPQLYSEVSVFFFTLWQATMETRLPTAKVIVSMMHVWGCVCFDSRQCYVPTCEAPWTCWDTEAKEPAGNECDGNSMNRPTREHMLKTQTQKHTTKYNNTNQTNTINTHRKKSIFSSLFLMYLMSEWSVFT